ncbi:PSD1 and planctomycete cytochrome C domain-containing protein [Pirellula sp. SH-Sr6A]|uniref:PSD1 and planctomycete cytochrome C domain-containing protein n=1 Tax=Pirellula sp. SH-Sr6A TaxID=1632865 RepID=UPI00143B2386|nr:PSD1 and planctomycete cytochrome C domain-containing protein [Pirellula sp. SH-Sr6A]
MSTWMVSPSPSSIFIRWPSILGLLIAIAFSFPRNAIAEEGGSKQYFESDIRPILREYCLDCHGASENPDGSLDLRLVRFMIQGGDSGPALNLDSPESSLLWERIASDEMPPGEGKVSAEKKERIRQWLQAKAPTRRPEPETIGYGIPLTDEERSYWAYQPISWPPMSQSREWVSARNSLDAIILQSMTDGLALQEDAPKPVQIRRVYMDLLGVPPSADDWERWNHCQDVDWYEQLVDALLADPRYGERWGRHWLDAVGYADSDGATIADAERAWAWRYRDYVIHSLNQDKPFDLFMREQLAGDEIAGPRAGDWTESQKECLVATGFLRMAADGTGSGDNTTEGRNKTISDTIQILGSTLLSSSLHCAQCHDHRYDPISQQDYFALRAVLEPSLDWKNWKTPSERLISLQSEADKARSQEIEAEAVKLLEDKAKKQAEFIKDALDKELAKFPDGERDVLRTAYETPADKRSDEQKELLRKNPSINITPGVLYQYSPMAAEELKKLDAKVAEIRAKKPTEEFVHALAEPPNHMPKTQLFHRGDPNQPTREVKPGKLSVLVSEDRPSSLPDDDDVLPTTGRRLAFAHWLTDRDNPNPLFLRSMVNRIWMHHFGRGIVETPGDFGRLGSAPTHPQLLDAMAVIWLDRDWSLKGLHRELLTASVYRQSSARHETGDSLDPDNRTYWRKPTIRLEAEAIRDSMLSMSGTLHTNFFGRPIPLQEDETGQVRIDPSQNRRSIYAKWRRTQPVAMLQSFDAPVMGIHCDVRTSSTVPTQSLMLINGEFAIEQASKIASRAIELAHQTRPEHFESWDLPAPPKPNWSYGTGSWNEKTQLLEGFEALEHFNGTQWQGSAKVPDERTGWSLLHASGGHPGNKQFPAIRRFNVPVDGTLHIDGKVDHPSENGDGISAVILKNGSPIGSWSAKKGSAPTALTDVSVRQGETVDFLVRCGENETSDSFQWPVVLNLKTEAGQSLVFDSVKQFAGPMESHAELPIQIQSAWRIVLHRDPDPRELASVKRFAINQLSLLQSEPERISKGSSVSKQLLTNVCQMLLCSNEFLYID